MVSGIEDSMVEDTKSWSVRISKALPYLLPWVMSLQAELCPTSSTKMVAKDKPPRRESSLMGWIIQFRKMVPLKEMYLQWTLQGLGGGNDDDYNWLA